MARREAGHSDEAAFIATTIRRSSGAQSGAWNDGRCPQCITSPRHGSIDRHTEHRPLCSVLSGLQPIPPEDVVVVPLRGAVRTACRTSEQQPCRSHRCSPTSAATRRHQLCRHCLSWKEGFVHASFTTPGASTRPNHKAGKLVSVSFSAQTNVQD